MNTRLAWFLCLVALGACGSDPAGPPHGELTGLFVLRSVNGAPLPATANSSSATEFRLVADTIRLYENGFGTEVTVTSRPDARGTTTNSQDLQVTETGVNSFDIAYPCNDTILISASCIAPPHHRGTRTAFGLVLGYSVAYRTPLVFERVGPAKD